MERNEKGYYRCKVKNAQLYKDMSLAYTQYCNPAMLAQLCHAWSTQKRGDEQFSQYIRNKG